MSWDKPLLFSGLTKVDENDIKLFIRQPKTYKSIKSIPPDLPSVSCKIFDLSYVQCVVMPVLFNNFLCAIFNLHLFLRLFQGQDYYLRVTVGQETEINSSSPPPPQKKKINKSGTDKTSIIAILNSAKPVSEINPSSVAGGLIYLY